MLPRDDVKSARPLALDADRATKCSASILKMYLWCFNNFDTNIQTRYTHEVFQPLDVMKMHAVFTTYYYMYIAVQWINRTHVTFDWKSYVILSREHPMSPPSILVIFNFAAVTRHMKMLSVMFSGCGLALDDLKNEDCLAIIVQS